MQKTVDWQGGIFTAYHRGKKKFCSDHYIIIHFEFLNHNHTVNADLYSCNVYKNLIRKCPVLIKKINVVLLYDNAEPHSARITQEKILDFVWSLQPISHIHQTLHHFFCSLQNALNNKKKFSRRSGEMFAKNFLSSKLAEFYLKGINKLSDKKHWVIQNNDKYAIK